MSDAYSEFFLFCFLNFICELLIPVVFFVVNCIRIICIYICFVKKIIKFEIVNFSFFYLLNKSIK